MRPVVAEQASREREDSIAIEGTKPFLVAMEKSNPNGQFINPLSTGARGSFISPLVGR